MAAERPDALPPCAVASTNPSFPQRRTQRRTRTICAVAIAVAAVVCAALPAAASATSAADAGGATPGSEPGVAGEGAGSGAAGATGTADATNGAPGALADRPAISSRADVRALQRALRVPADGVLGPRTRSALRRAQRRAGLPADGVPRRSTLTQLGIELPSASSTSSAALDLPAGDEPPPLVQAARSRIGSPYEWGSTGPDTFDCSGLVTWSAHQLGLRVPRTSFELFKTGERIARDEIQPGDLVFFDTGGPGASDVGIASSTTTVISATTSRGVAEHAIFDAYWGAHFLGARRIA